MNFFWPKGLRAFGLGTFIHIDLYHTPPLRWCSSSSVLAPGNRFFHFILALAKGKSGGGMNGMARVAVAPQALPGLARFVRGWRGLAGHLATFKRGWPGGSSAVSP